MARTEYQVNVKSFHFRYAWGVHTRRIFDLQDEHADAAASTEQVFLNRYQLTIDGALIYWVKEEGVALVKERFAYIHIDQLLGTEPAEPSLAIERVKLEYPSHPVRVDPDVRDAVNFFITLPRPAIIQIASLLTTWKCSPTANELISPTFCIHGDEGPEYFLPETVSFTLE